jgi:hypothetical protein
VKIKCIKIYNEITKECQKVSPWLTVGNEYVVLEVEVCSGKDVLYRLVGDNEDKSPALYDASQFEITSELVSSNWSISIVDNSLIILGPKVWRENGFWVDCYDGEPKELEIYKREARIIYEEENASL